MSKRLIELFVIDIIIAIDKIKRYTDSFNSADELLHSEMQWDATIRELEIIGEATKNLLNEKFLEDEWRVIVDFRNIIIHEYFGIEHNEVYEVVKVDILEFEKEILKSLNKFNNNELLQVIEDSIIDHKYNEKVISLLEEIKNELGNV